MSGDEHELEQAATMREAAHEMLLGLVRPRDKSHPAKVTLELFAKFEETLAQYEEAVRHEERLRQKHPHRKSSAGPALNSISSRLRLLSKSSDTNKPKERPASTRSDGFVISGPTGFKSVLHVDTDLKWSGDDPASSFDLEQKVGEGAFGAVYRGVHRDTKMELAIKVVKAGKTEMDEMRKEVDILKQLKDDNIVKYYGTVQSSDAELWILMDFCGGGSLLDVLRRNDAVGRGKRIAEEEIAAVMTFVLKGLDAIHHKGIVHRDLKAANILLNDRGEPKIADFGISVQPGAGNKNAIPAGTPLFMPPEVLEGASEPSVKTDIWSLGITAIEFAQGVPPYYEENLMRAIFLITTNEPPTLKEPKKWSTNFLDFVALCLNRDPEERPTARQLLSHPFVLTAQTKDNRAVLQNMLKCAAAGASGLGPSSSSSPNSSDSASSSATTTAANSSGGSSGGAGGGGSGGGGGGGSGGGLNGVGNDNSGPAGRIGSRERMSTMLVPAFKRDAAGRTELHECVTSKQTESLKKLLATPGKATSDLINAQDDNGWTALHVAGNDGDLEACELLLRHPLTQVDILNRDGTTALHYVVRIKPASVKDIARLISVIQLLLDKGADVNSRTRLGETALHFAVMRGNLDAIRFLAGRKDINVNTATTKGDTALHFAVLIRNQDVVKSLLAIGADRSLENQKGQTPVSLAKASKLDAITELLAAAPADSAATTATTTAAAAGKA